MTEKTASKIIVFIPAYNEERAIGKVISDFKRCLPGVDIVVIDNNSQDQTAKIAKDQGAIVLEEKRQGKGFAIRKFFQEIKADIYVMIDADDTYPAEEVQKLLDPILQGEADMTVGTRLEQANNETLNLLHQAGNKFFVFFVNFCFRSRFKDIFSGYRVMTHEFVKNIPLLSSGFEIEAELTIQALERGFRIKEIPVKYRARPAGSYSKLRTWQDGWKILLSIFAILRDYRPMTFFTILAFLFFLAGLFFGLIVIFDYLQKGIVTRVPFAILSSLLIILGFSSFIGGFVVSSVNRRFEEILAIWKKKS